MDLVILLSQFIFMKLFDAYKANFQVVTLLCMNATSGQDQEDLQVTYKTCYHVINEQQTGSHLLMHGYQNFYCTHQIVEVDPW